MAGRPDGNPDHKRSELKPCLSVDVVKPFITFWIKHSITPTCLTYASNDVIMLSKYDCFNGKEL
jgi:hypothetical protein